MKPGRELDALVAEKVMGWRWFTDEFNPRPVLVPPGMPRQSALPSFSTDIAAAWEVVERLRGMEPELSWNDEARCWIVGFWKGPSAPSTIHGSSDSAPNAICLAALKAVGRLEKE